MPVTYPSCTPANTPAKAGAQLGELCDELRRHPNWTPAFAGVRFTKGMVPHVPGDPAVAGMTDKANLTLNP